MSVLGAKQAPDFNAPVEKGGIAPVQFPMVADVKREITQACGVEHPDCVATRAPF